MKNYIIVAVIILIIIGAVVWFSNKNTSTDLPADVEIPADASGTPVEPAVSPEIPPVTGETGEIAPTTTAPVEVTQ